MNFAPAAPRMIGEPRPLEASHLAALFTGQSPAARKAIKVESLRNAHHRVARLYAAGLTLVQIAERTGRSASSLSTLLQSPAMTDLVAHYRRLVDAKFVESTDEYHEQTRENMLQAERLISDRLHDSEESGEPLPLKDLVLVSRDAADRLGYGKKSQVTNVNVDFAAQLERANARIGRTVDATPNARSTEDA